MKPGRPAIFGTLSNGHDLHCRIKKTFLFPFSEDFDTVKRVPETVNQGHLDDVTNVIDQIDPFDVYLLYQQHGLQSNGSLSTPQDTSDTPIHEPVKRTNTLILREPKRVKFESQSRSFANTPKNQEPMDPVSQPTTRSSNPSGQIQDCINEPEYVKKMCRLVIKSSHTEGTGGFTELIRSHNQRAIIASKAPEETSDSRINAAFVLRVGTLCLALPTGLKWNQIQRQITRQCGKANIRSIVDGGLVDPNGECRIIIEAKAQRRTAKAWRSLLMQQGLDMVAFIAHAHKSSRESGRVIEQRHRDHALPSSWIMLSQYGTEMFVTVAEIHQEYLDYLLQGSLQNPHSLASFLTLRLYRSPVGCFLGFSLV